MTSSQYSFMCEYPASPSVLTTFSCGCLHDLSRSRPSRLLTHLYDNVYVYHTPVLPMLKTIPSNVYILACGLGHPQTTGTFGDKSYINRNTGTYTRSQEHTSSDACAWSFLLFGLSRNCLLLECPRTPRRLPAATTRHLDSPSDGIVLQYQLELLNFVQHFELRYANKHMN